MRVRDVFSSFRFFLRLLIWGYGQLITKYQVRNLFHRIALRLIIGRATSDPGHANFCWRAPGPPTSPSDDKLGRSSNPPSSSLTQSNNDENYHLVLLTTIVAHDRMPWPQFLTWPKAMAASSDPRASMDRTRLIQVRGFNAKSALNTWPDWTHK